MRNMFTLTAILQLRDRMTRRLRASRDEARRLREEIRRLQEQQRLLEREGLRGTGALQKGFGGLIGTIMGVAAALGATIGAAKLLQSTLGAAMEYEMSQATITAMFQGDTKSAGEYMDMVGARALSSPLYGEMDYLSNSKSFLAMSKDMGELEQMWNLAERLGAMDPAQGLEGAIFALRELMSGSSVSMSSRFEMNKGTMNKIKNMKLPDQLKAMDELLTDMGFGTDFLDQISGTALAIKNTIAERFAVALRKVGTDGLEALKPYMIQLNELMAAPGFDKFVADAGKAFGKFFGFVGKTTIAIVENFGKIMDVVKAVGVGLATAFAISKFVALQQAIVLAGGLVGALWAILTPVLVISVAVGALYYAWSKNMFGLKDATTQVFDFLAPYLSQAWERIKSVFAMGAAIVTGGMKIITGDLQGGWAALRDGVGSDAGGPIYQVFYKMYQAIEKGKLIVMSALAIFKGDFDGVLNNLQEAFGKTGGSAIFTYFQNMKKNFDIGVSIIKGFAQFMSGNPTEALATLTDSLGTGTGTKVFEVFGQIKDIAMNVWEVVLHYWNTVIPKIVEVVKKYLPMIIGFLQGLGAKIGPVLATAFGIIVSIVQTIMPIVVDLVKSAWDFILYIIEDIGPGVVSTVQAIWTEVVWAFTSVWDFIATCMPMILQIVTFAWNAMSGSVFGTLQTIWIMVKTFFGLIWNYTAVVFNTIWNIIKIAWTLISGLFKIGLQLLTGDWKGAWETLKETTSTLIDQIIELIVDLVSGAWKLGKDFVMGLVDGVLSAAGNLINTVKGIYDSVKGIFSDKPINVPVSINTSQINGNAGISNAKPSKASTPITKYRTGDQRSASSGLEYVPYDRFPAILHKGEAVVRAEDNNARKGKKKGKSAGELFIAKIADQVIIREDADIDKLVDKIADMLLEAGGQGA